MAQKIRQITLQWAVAFAVPLSSTAGWKEIHFGKIPANRVSYTAEGLKLEVKRSSSPLVLPLANPKLAQGFEIELSVQGELKTDPKAFPEDAYLRIGLVVPGDRHLSALERMMAPEWITTLFSLTEKDTGLDRIYFFDITDQSDRLNQERIIPGSRELMSERLVASRQSSDLHLTQKFLKPYKVAALWLAADGDDSGSTFTLVIKSLNLL